MSLQFKVIFLVLVYASLSLATYYEKPKHKKYIMKMRWKRLAVAGTCECFVEAFPCPNGWTRQKIPRCSALDRVEDANSWNQPSSGSGQLQGMGSGGSSMWNVINGQSSRSNSYGSYSKYDKYSYKKKVIKIKKVLIEHKACCPPLRFFFYEYPTFLEVGEASVIPDEPAK